MTMPKPPIVLSRVDPTYGATQVIACFINCDTLLYIATAVSKVLLQ
jgi:hypothetical protein